MKPNSIEASSAACVVCALSDARALLSVRLGDGTEVVLCGTHALIHQRVALAGALQSIPELRQVTGERRERDRRGDLDALSADALSADLADAFAPGRRSRVDRRVS